MFDERAWKMKKPAGAIKLLAEEATADPQWRELGGQLLCFFREEGSTVVMRSRAEWQGKGLEEMKRLIPASRRTLGQVWCRMDSEWFVL